MGSLRRGRERMGMGASSAGRGGQGGGWVFGLCGGWEKAEASEPQDTGKVQAGGIYPVFYADQGGQIPAYTGVDPYGRRRPGDDSPGVRKV